MPGTADAALRHLADRGSSLLQVKEHADDLAPLQSTNVQTGAQLQEQLRVLQHDKVSWVSPLIQTHKRQCA